MVTDVGDGMPTELDPIAEGGTDMRYISGSHLGITDREVGVVHGVEPDVADQIADAHREVRRAHELFERLGQREPLLGRAIDVELRAFSVDRCTERQTLHMVPMEMGDQGMSVERAVLRLGLAEEAEAGAEIEHDGFATRNVDRHARRIAAVTAVRLA